MIAADVNDEFLDFINERINKDQIKNVVTRKIPFDNPLLTDNESDMVLVVNTYHHIEHRSDYFSKVKRNQKEWRAGNYRFF